MSKFLSTLVGLAVLMNLGCEKARETHENLHPTLWTQAAGEYHAISSQTFFLAKLQLARALEDATWSAALEQPAGSFDGLPPAIIVDVDETILDNAPYQAQLVVENAEYTTESWAKWVQDRSAPALPGAKDFLDFVQSQGVEIFYVTNRASELEEDTRVNLKQEGLPLNEDYDVVLTKGENGWESDKKTRREAVAQTHRILLLMGDDLNDFFSGARANNPEDRQSLVKQHEAMWGEKWLVLPNPSYGSWEASLFGRDYELSDAEKLRAKYGHLKPFQPSAK